MSGEGGELAAPVSRRGLAAGAAAALAASGLARPAAAGPGVGGAGREVRGYAHGPFGQIHYRRVGVGPAVLLLHQAPLSSLEYHAAAPLLAAEGFSTIAVDLPGLGLSDPPPRPPSIADYADAMAALAARLRLRRPAVVGHQTGALIAGALATRAPGAVGRVVLHGAPLYDAAERQVRLQRPHPDHALKPDGSHLTARWAMVGGPGGAGMSDAARQLGVLAFYDNGPLDWYAHAAAYAYDFAPDLARIRCPALVLANLADPIGDHGRRLTAQRPDFAYAELGGGAQSVLDAPAAWAKAVAAFLRS